LAIIRLGIAAVLLNAGVTLVLAVDEITVAAVLTVPTATAEEANTHSLPNGPTLNVFADGIDPTHRLVTRYRGHWIGKIPSTVAESEWHTPQASTRIRT